MEVSDELQHGYRRGAFRGLWSVFEVCGDLGEDAEGPRHRLIGGEGYETFRIHVPY